MPLPMKGLLTRRGKGPLSSGLFVSDKYKENEVVLFNENKSGFVIRGGSSKVEFSFDVLPGDTIEIVWRTDASKAKSTKEKEKVEDNRPQKNFWFLSGSSLITSAVNVYSFYRQQPIIEPGSIYVNVRTPLTIYETGQIFGFRFPTSDELANAYVRRPALLILMAWLLAGLTERTHLRRS